MSTEGEQDFDNVIGDPEVPTDLDDFGESPEVLDLTDVPAPLQGSQEVLNEPFLEEIPAAQRKVGAFLPKDGHVTRQEAIEFINLQRWAREGCCQAMYATLLWITFLFLVNVHSHIETSYDVFRDVTNSIKGLEAEASRGIAPTAIFSAAGESSCSCACPSLCGETIAGGESLPGVPVNAPRFTGSVQPEQLQSMRAKSYYLKTFAGAQPTKQLKDVKTIQDVWFWLQHGMIPEVWNEEPRINAVNMTHLFQSQGILDAVSAALDPTEKPGYILRWNKVIGGVRLRQYRLRPDDCRADQSMAAFFGQTCHMPKLSYSPFGPGLEAYVEGFVADQDNKGAFDVYLDTERPIHMALETMQYILHAHNWLDTSTDVLLVQIPTLNVEATPALLGLLEIRFDFTRSGTLSTKVNLRTASASPYSRTIYWYSGDAVFMLLLVYLIFKKLFVIIKHRFEKKHHDTLCNFWFMFDGATIFYGIVLVGLWLYIVAITSSIGENISTLPAAPPYDAYEEVVNAYHKAWGTVLDDIDSMVGLREVGRLLQFAYTTQLIFQFLKSFRGQPKLAQLTRTLMNSAEDLVHFVLAFVVLFLTFAFTGHLVYGLRLKAWSTATLSINSSFRALKGDVELTDMYDVAPFTTVVWFWLFLWSQIFVMNNLLLAQLYDHFQVVKAQANSFTTFLLQLKDVLRDVHRREGKKMMCCFCCCRCRKRDDYPSHADMLEDLMDKAGYSPGEKHSVFRTVNGPKRMRKHTEKHVFAGEIPVEHLSEDVQAPAEADLKAMVLIQTTSKACWKTWSTTGNVNLIPRRFMSIRCASLSHSLRLKWLR
jgi:hypothetical protein